MRVYHLKLLSTVFLVATVFLTAWAWRIVSSPVVDLTQRPLAQPETSSKAETIHPVIDKAAPLSNVFARPLFRPDRRPFEPDKVSIVQPEPQVPPPAPASPPAPEPPPSPVAVVQAPLPVPVFPQITLKGVRRTGQNEVALLETPDFPLGRWFALGSDVSSWRLKSISDDGVTFISGDLTQVLQLYVDNPTNGIGNPQ